MIKHLLQVVAEAHPLRSYLRLVYDITTGIPVELANKVFEGCHAERYQHAWLCFALLMIYITFLVFMAVVFTPVFKALIVKKFGASPVTAWIITAGCKSVLRAAMRKIVIAINRRLT